MKNIKTLAFFAVGAFAVSIAYALIVKGDVAVLSFDDDSGQPARHTIHGDSGEFVLKEDGYTVKAAWRGDYSLNDLGSTLGALDDEIEIEIKQGDTKERVEFENSGHTINITYYRNGDKQPDGEDVNNAAAAIFLKFLRISGLKSDERVGALIKTGGAASVLEEIDALEGDHAIRRYAVALIEQTDLSPSEVNILTEKFALIESDLDLRIAAVALLENDALTAAQAARLLTTAGGQIESDHDLRMVLSESADFFSPDGDFAEAWMQAYGELQSSYDQRLALQEIAAAAERDPALMAAYRKAAQAISADQDRKRALEAIGEEAEP